MFRIAPGLRARGNSTTKPTKMKGGRRGRKIYQGWFVRIEIPASVMKFIDQGPEA